MFREVAVKTAERIPAQGRRNRCQPENFQRTFSRPSENKGFLSILLPEEYGGNGGDITSFCLVIEEIAKVCGSSSLLILAQGMGSMPIFWEETRLKRNIISPRSPKRISLAAFALTEPECRI